MNKIIGKIVGLVAEIPTVIVWSCTMLPILLLSVICCKLGRYVTVPIKELAVNKIPDSLETINYVDTLLHKISVKLAKLADNEIEL